MRLILVFLSVLLLVPPIQAEVKPHPLIADGMVLQQERAVPLWGTAAEGEKITVRFRGKEVQTVAKEGRWSLKLASGAAGGPFEMTIAGQNTLTYPQVYVGEVWVCSGQSNMGWPLAPRPGSAALVGTENPALRLFTVPTRASEKAQNNLNEGHWLECGPNTVGNFSAVAFYFGRDLQRSLKVPVGLIHASYGGSPVEQWLSPRDVPTPPAAKESPRERPRPTTGGLYHGMIATLQPFALRGVIWYQGEANTSNPAGYRAAFRALIHSWRKDWGQGDFPFLFVQLAPYGKIVQEPQESKWALVRETQRWVSQTVPNTGMVVITDCGHESNIHPMPKEPVGERLALLARALVYGQKITYSGPDYAGMKIDGNKAILSFRHLGKGLEAKEMVLEDVRKDGRTGVTGGALHVKAGSTATAKLQGFTVCGEDGKYVNAVAEIQGNTVHVWSPSITRPVAVRYGWADYPTGNLFNRAGLPAAPFRTDAPEK